jgi:hypothetical protein
VISPWPALRSAKVELSGYARRDGPHVERIGISRALARVPGANLHLVPPASRLSRDAPLA